jgi:FG-GAP-like repeat
VAVADVNNDGIPDLLFAAGDEFGNYNLYVSLRKGDGTFKKPVALGAS